MNKIQMSGDTTPPKRSIPYNYSSFHDTDIVQFFLGDKGTDLVRYLRDQKVTGVSARMLYEILGDLWVVKRNPFIQEDLISNLARRTLLLEACNHKVSLMHKRAKGNRKALELISLTKNLNKDFSMWLNGFQKKRKRIVQALLAHVQPSVIDTSPYGRISCCTDATDWRYELPLLVLNPDSEEVLPGILKVCQELDLIVIPRGGATGYNGGIVPLHEHSVVLNLEKFTSLNSIVHKEVAHNKTMATIVAGAGVITSEVSQAAASHGLVFAVDPTSQDASTIGGNVATNAGGKKALLWGTALDNLLSWKMINASGNWLQVQRINHNGAKIHDQQTVEFEVCESTPKGILLSKKTLTFAGNQIRKEGLGKDVTKKHLFGLPGVQKEGCDGIIVSAEFILHKRFSFTRTLCLEFYNQDMVASVECIAAIKKQGDDHSSVYLAALEHLDHYYINAIRYSPKGSTSVKPNMLLLLDAVSNDEQELAQFCEDIITLTQPYQVQSFLAVSNEARVRFWDDRKRTAAIASHTNAFKLNEDVVIPLERLVEYSRGIQEINLEMRIKNKRYGCTIVLKALNDSKCLAMLPSGDAEMAKACNSKLREARELLEQSSAHYATQLDAISQGTNASSLTKYSFKEFVLSPLKKLFAGDEFKEIRTTVTNLHKEVVRKRLFIALHMHAGDGNVHSNIPVNSDDSEMMQEAQEMVHKIMKLAVFLDGVISGEHGIGITKMEFLQEKERSAFQEYKKTIDPHDRFNRDKLTKNLSLTQCYTPSLHLLEQEAILLEESELGTLNQMVKNCLRCGKCKPVCATHVPEANLLYSPRNKILATSSLIESFLYEEQTRRGISLSHFESMLDVADHCTVCHKCVNPCPVNIDFGDVTMLMRKILRNRKQYPVRILPSLMQVYLAMRKEGLVHITYQTVLKFAMACQRIASKLLRFIPKVRTMLKNPKPTTTAAAPAAQIIHFMARPLPGSLPSKPMRVLLGAGDQRFIPIFRKPSSANAKSVFYFPGCGSERLYSTIGLATIALLYDLGVQTVLPPGYICCGYPQRAGGHDAKSKAMIAENRVLFHRMSNSLNYLAIDTVVVSCGTCYDQLTHYQLDKIFDSAMLIDIHEYLFESKEFVGRHAKAVSASKGERYLYHSPCHSPIKKNDAITVAKTLLAAEEVLKTDRCCGESGSFAFERPDIATQVRHSKAKSLERSLEALAPTSGTTTKVLTSCPACHQGISRFGNELPIESDYLVVEYARKIFGNSWQENFVDRVTREGGLEKILL